MRSHLLILVLFISSLGCARSSGSATQSIPAWFPDDQILSSYKSDYLQIALNETGADLSKEVIPIRFAKLGYSPEEGGTNGMCRIFTNSNGELLSRFVEIDSVFFSVAPEGQRRELVLHEMGHCSLRRPHRNDTANGIPLSIMYPTTLSNSLFLGRLQTYLSELFSNSYLINPQAEQLFSVSKSSSHKLNEDSDPQIYVIELESHFSPSGDHRCTERHHFSPSMGKALN